jgi:hypothetical protein
MKHPHKNIIDKWLNDISLEFEYKRCMDATIIEIIQDIDGEGQFNIKEKIEVNNK